MFRRPAHKRAPLLALAAAIVLIARAIVPAGYMLAPTTAGATVILCTDHGPVSVPAGPARHTPSGEHEGLCPFAASADAGRDAVVPAPLAPLPVTPHAHASPERPSPFLGIAAPPPPATGPPASL